ncbi:hypothetical protein BLNAU_12740 [Blattamonas nauphoetae]|uniref:Methyltransferase type 11 domain-containing protein n=1 Tax=Blattamonas nauphoetae TaxID=2049346 RepID=A0ABQ9XQE7_9EUKA|nr:hypothetical protein BLNAU_12740 [Blattamonas nauphoetae]
MSHPDIKERFNAFTDETYARQYKADSVYKLLEDYLDLYVKDGDIVIEGIPFFVHSFMTSYCFEPSAMAESAKEVCAKLPVKATGIKQDEPGERPYHVHRLAAHEMDKVNPPLCDVLVANRMLHEWRLYELNQGMEFDVSAKILGICMKHLKPGGIFIVGDFMYQYGIPEDLLKKEMEDLRVRLGHTHPPSEYVTAGQIREAVKYGSGMQELKTTVLSLVETDTHRQYWMVSACRV